MRRKSTTVGRVDTGAAMVSRWPIKWGRLAAGAGAFILLVCGPGSCDLPFARAGFTACLAILSAVAVALFRQGRWYSAALTIVVVATLLLLSLLPVYVEHWVPWGGGKSHRHILWDLGHVH